MEKQYKISSLFNNVTKNKLRELYYKNQIKSNLTINLPLFFLGALGFRFLIILYLLLACLFFNHIIYDYTINKYIKSFIILTIITLFFYKTLYFSYYITIIFTIILLNIYQEFLLKNNNE